MAPMMGEGMNSEVGPPHPGMMNKKQFPPGEKNVRLSSEVFAFFFSAGHENFVVVFFFVCPILEFEIVENLKKCVFSLKIRTFSLLKSTILSYNLYFYFER